MDLLYFSDPQYDTPFYYVYEYILPSGRYTIYYKLCTLRYRYILYTLYTHTIYAHTLYIHTLYTHAIYTYSINWCKDCAKYTRCCCDYLVLCGCDIQHQMGNCSQNIAEGEY